MFHKLFALAALSTLLAACSGEPNGSEYAGRWADKSGKASSIVMDGNAIFIVDPRGKKFPATYSPTDHTLKLSGAFGSVVVFSYVKSNDTILVMGEELHRVN